MFVVRGVDAKSRTPKSGHPRGYIYMGLFGELHTQDQPAPVQPKAGLIPVVVGRGLLGNAFAGSACSRAAEHGTDFCDAITVTMLGEGFMGINRTVDYLP